MRYYIWDKETSVAGVSAAYLMEVKPEFAEETVIGIIDDYGILLHFETMRSLQNKYKVWSNIPKVLGESIVEKLEKGYKLQPNGLLDNLSESNRIYLESIMYDVRFDDAVDQIFPGCEPSCYQCYKEPDCKITTTKVNDDTTRSLTVIIENLAFIDKSLEKIYEMKIMKRLNERKCIIKDKIHDAMTNKNEEDVEKYTTELEELHESLLSMNLTLNVTATDVYEYSNFILVKTSDGQTVIIDKDVVSSCRHNALSYEKSKDDGTKGPVHYETVYVKLSEEIETELREFDETVYITY